MTNLFLFAPRGNRCKIVYEDVVREVCEDVVTKICDKIWKDDDYGDKVWADNLDYSGRRFYKKQEGNGPLNFRAIGL